MRKRFTKMIVAVAVLLVLTIPQFVLASNFPSAQQIFGTQDQREDAQEGPSSITPRPAETDQGLFSGEQNAEDSTERRAVGLPTGNLFNDILPQAINIALYGLGIAFFVALFYGGVVMLISQGDEEKIGKVKDMIIHAVIGAAVIGGAFAVVLGLAQLLLDL